jgi:hypothetical protein
LEARSPKPEHERITEVHHRIINADGTPARNPDGTPWIIVNHIKE